MALLLLGLPAAGVVNARIPCQTQSGEMMLFESAGARRVLDEPPTTRPNLIGMKFGVLLPQVAKKDDP